MVESGRHKEVGTNQNSGLNSEQNSVYSALSQKEI